MGLTAVLAQLGAGAVRTQWREPEPLGASEVRVRFRALSLNYRDLLIARGHYAPGIALPLVPGSDAAGEVVEAGDSGSGFAPGDRVCTHLTPAWQDGPLEAAMRASALGGPQDGVFAEERVLPAGALVRIPDSLGFEDAACLPVAGLTAWSALQAAGLTVAAAGQGRPQRVLLIGTGGVSMLGLQIANALGYPCAVVTGSEHKREPARRAGAELILDRHDPSWPAAVRRWSGGGVDLVLEVGGDGTFDQSLAAVRDNGCIALIGVLARRGQAVRLEDVLMRRIKVQGIYVGSRDDLEMLLQFVATSGVRPVIGKHLGGLRQIRRAYASIEAATHPGKCVLTLDDMT